MTSHLKVDINNSDVLILRQKDKVLSQLIGCIGNLTIDLEKDYYSALVKRIIGQQLSLKSTDTIWNRLCKDSDFVSVEYILEFSDNALRGFGISRAKICYIKDLANKVMSSEIELEKLSGLSNEEVTNQLTKVKGIGLWTAEMFLIFSLGRENVLSSNDVSIKNAIKWLYQLGEEGVNWEKY